MMTNDEPAGATTRLVAAADRLDRIAGAGAAALGITGLAVAYVLGQRSVAVLLVIAVLGGIHAWFAYAAASALSSIARALAAGRPVGPRAGTTEQTRADTTP